MSAIVSAIKSAPTNWHKGKIDKNLTGKYCLKSFINIFYFFIS